MSEAQASAQDYFNRSNKAQGKSKEVPDAASAVTLDTKRAVGRRIKRAVMVVPMVLIMIALCSRWVVGQGASSSWTPGTTLRRRDGGSTSIVLPSASAPASGASSASAAPAASTPASGQPLPTAPSAPPTLPTPFPQPLDSLAQNFSTQDCFNFFTNMTNTPAFRSCRPFSLLLQSSDAFVEAQDNITTLSNIMWGTCNTTLSSDTCNANMAWFASTLQTSCKAELKASNAAALTTLSALQAYPLMRQTGCLIDQVSNAYCYVEAVHNSNPSDLYFYQLPLGIPLPNNTTPSCSPCTKTLMAMYAQAASNLTAVKATYKAAADIAEAQCGAGYASSQVTATSGAISGRSLASSWHLGAAALVAGLFMVLAS